jgi:4-oxalocrotonate tautomerase
VFIDATGAGLNRGRALDAFGLWKDVIQSRGAPVSSGMPYVNVQVTSGVTRDQKAALVRDITASLMTNLGKRPEHIHIVIQEIDPENWGFRGELTSDLRAEHGEPNQR